MTDDSKWKDMVALETMLVTISSAVGTLHMEVGRLDRLATEVADTITMGIVEGKTFEDALAEVDVSPNEFCAAFDTMAGMCEHLAKKAREFTATFVEDMGAKPCEAFDKEADPN